MLALVRTFVFVVVLTAAASGQEAKNGITNSTDGNGGGKAPDLLGLEGAPGVYYGAAAGLGLIVALFGYRLFKPTIFLVSFLVGGYFSYDLTDQVFDSDTLKIAIAFVVALALALLALYFARLGIFLAGAAAGVLVAQIITTTFVYRMSPEDKSTQVMVLTTIAGGLVVGLVALCIHRPVLIVVSAWIGSVLTVRGVGHFAGGFPMADEVMAVSLAANDNVDGPIDVPSVWLTYMASTVGLFIVSLVIQFKRSGSIATDDCAAGQRYKEFKV